MLYARRKRQLSPQMLEGDSALCAVQEVLRELIDCGDLLRDRRMWEHVLEMIGEKSVFSGQFLLKEPQRLF